MMMRIFFFFPTGFIFIPISPPSLCGSVKERASGLISCRGCEEPWKKKMAKLQTMKNQLAGQSVSVFGVSYNLLTVLILCDWALGAPIQEMGRLFLDCRDQTSLLVKTARLPLSIKMWPLEISWIYLLCWLNIAFPSVSESSLSCSSRAHLFPTDGLSFRRPPAHQRTRIPPKVLLSTSLWVIPAPCSSLITDTPPGDRDARLLSERLMDRLRSHTKSAGLPHSTVSVSRHIKSAGLKARC